MDLFSSVAQNQGHGRVGASPWTSCQSVAGLNLSKKLMKFKKSRKGVSGMQRLPKTWMETRLVRSCLKSLHIQCEKYWSNKCMWASISAETERTWYIIPFADTSMIQYDTTPPPHTHTRKIRKYQNGIHCIALLEAYRGVSGGGHRVALVLPKCLCNIKLFLYCSAMLLYVHPIRTHEPETVPNVLYAPGRRKNMCCQI